MKDSEECKVLAESIIEEMIKELESRLSHLQFVRQKGLEEDYLKYRFIHPDKSVLDFIDNVDKNHTQK